MEASILDALSLLALSCDTWLGAFCVQHWGYRLCGSRRSPHRISTEQTARERSDGGIGVCGRTGKTMLLLPPLSLLLPISPSLSLPLEIPQPLSLPLLLPQSLSLQMPLPLPLPLPLSLPLPLPVPLPLHYHYRYHYH